MDLNLDLFRCFIINTEFYMVIFYDKSCINLLYENAVMFVVMTIDITITFENLCSLVPTTGIGSE